MAICQHLLFIEISLERGFRRVCYVSKYTVAIGDKIGCATLTDVLGIFAVGRTRHNEDGSSLTERNLSFCENFDVSTHFIFRAPYEANPKKVRIIGIMGTD